MTPKQVRAARQLLCWSQADLAKEAGVGITTVADWELERRQPSFRVLGAMREALERAGVEFTSLLASRSARSARLKSASHPCLSYVCSHSPINRTIARNANPNSITIFSSRCPRSRLSVRRIRVFDNSN